MTGISIINAVTNFLRFIRVIAGIGIFVFAALLLVGLSKFFSLTYSRWGLFVGRYITGSNNLSGRNLTVVWLTGLVIRLIAWFGFAGLQTAPTSPLRPWE
jgi:hypothetical protein